MSNEVRPDELLYFEDFPIGKTYQYCKFPLTRDLVEAYAAEFDPLFGGQERDRAGQHYASPWQLLALLIRLTYDGWMHGAATRGAPGVDELFWFRPVRAGETLSARYTVRDARVSRSRPELGLAHLFYELLGDDGEPVISQLNWVMILRRDAEAVTEANAQVASPSSHSEPPDDTSNSIPIVLGERIFPMDEMLAFSRMYDPQPFHVDLAAAAKGVFGALAASGWHTAAQWANAYATTYAAGGPLPRPHRLLWAKPVVWRKPVFVDDRIAFDFLPIKSERAADGKKIIISRNRGLNAKGEIVYDFTMAMSTAD